ncbi:YidC/Oxa1 family insertase periplasmic-domain containing protein [Candidatus Dependentiae bacterium]
MQKNTSGGILNAILLGLATFLIVKYFFASKPADRAIEGREDLSGQVFQAPVSNLEARKLNKEIDFIDKKIPSGDQEIFVATSLCEYTFSPNGAVLSGLDFKENRGPEGDFIRTVYNRQFEEREQGCFLLAMDEKTPYVYKFLGVDSKNGKHIVSFQTEVDGWQIRKSFELNDYEYDIKVSLSFEPKNGVKTIRPRLFVPGPFSGSISEDKINGIVSGLDKASLNKVTDAQEHDFGWKLPAIFGAEDKYFLHSFHGISDESFVERAYYKRFNNRGLFSIFECRKISKSSSVTMKFYFGPKTIYDLEASDERLKNVLSFGWFSKLMILLLSFLEYLFGFLGNYGMAIMLLALLIKLAFLPLTLLARRKASEVMAVEARYAGEIRSINLRYKNDFLKRSESIATFYREHGISQLGKMAGTIPLLLQAPFFISLYYGLRSYIALYQANFLWLSDLSSKDPFFILPVILGVFMLMQQQTSPIIDQKVKWMTYMMPLVVVAVMANFPAGAVLYWTSNTVLMLGEEQIMRLIFGKIKRI